MGCDVKWCVVTVEMLCDAMCCDAMMSATGHSVCKTTGRHLHATLYELVRQSCSNQDSQCGSDKALQYWSTAQIYSHSGSYSACMLAAPL